MTFLARQRFRAHDHRDRIEAFGWLASRNAVIGGDKRQRDVVRVTSAMALFLLNHTNPSDRAARARNQQKRPTELSPIRPQETHSLRSTLS